MPAYPYSRFYWEKWLAEPGLKLCSWAARGLWADMLALAGLSDRYGYVMIAGQPATPADLARALGGGDEATVIELLAELERNRVFSRDRFKRIYNRRMVKEGLERDKNRANGKKGGNPALRKDATISEGVNRPLVNQYTNIPEETQSSVFKTELNLDTTNLASSVAPPKNRRRSMGVRLPDEWTPDLDCIAFAEGMGLDPRAVGDEFVDYWRSVSGAKALRVDWNATFRNRCRQIAERRQGRNGASKPPLESWSERNAREKREAIEKMRRDAGEGTKP